MRLWLAPERDFLCVCLNIVVDIIAFHFVLKIVIVVYFRFFLF